MPTKRRKQYYCPSEYEYSNIFPKMSKLFFYYKETTLGNLIIKRLYKYIKLSCFKQVRKKDISINHQ